MKKYLLLLFLLLIPTSVFAQDYEGLDVYPSLSSRSHSIENLATLEAGDVIHFPTTVSSGAHPWSYDIYIDHQKLENCYGSADSCLSEYTIDKKYLIGGNPSSTIVGPVMNRVIELYTYDEDKIRFYDPEDMEPYMPGDIIIFTAYEFEHEQSEFYVYDYSNELIVDSVISSNTYFAYQFPDLGDRNTVWIVDIFDDGFYDTPMPHYHPVAYQEPMFSLKCNDDHIEYGKKTKCNVTVKSVFPLDNVSFNLSNSNFKITNPKITSELTTFQGDKEYNFTFPDNYDFQSNYVLMTFDVEATKPENYTDTIQILDIHYMDTVKDDDYGDLDGAISVIYKMINPDTFNNLFFIIIPVFLCGVAALYSQTVKKEKKEQ